MNYLLITWGGFYNQEHKEKHGKEPGYYWFDSPKDREDYIRYLKGIEVNLQAFMLATDTMDGQESRMKTVASMVFVYQGKEYPYEYDFGYGFGEAGAEYMFKEGNYSCDCNRSSFLRQKYPEFPDLDCGDSIELKSFETRKVTAPEGVRFLPMER